MYVHKDTTGTFWTCWHIFLSEQILLKLSIIIKKLCEKKPKQIRMAVFFFQNDRFKMGFMYFID